MIHEIIRQSKDLIAGPIDPITKTSFLYFNDFGIGYLEPDPNHEEIYTEQYFLDYVPKAQSTIGMLLNTSRSVYTMISTETSKSVCDIGIGCGNFIELYDCVGTDVNPYAIDYLKGIGRLANLEEGYDYFTMWDVIEHIDDPRELFKNVRNGIVLSTPIYTDREDMLTSKHYKPNEHLWYFTDMGIKVYMKMLGFYCVSQNMDETQIGRHSIGSYFFKRF